MKKDPAILLIGSKACTGCLGCVDACPVNALSVVLDEEGFYRPIVGDSCTKCGVCADHCPVLIPKKTRDCRSQYPLFWGGWSFDDEVLQKSSSGGVFYELAHHVIAQDGVVVAARWEGLKVVHDFCMKEEDLPDFMGSKYIPSDTTGIYKKVIVFLNEGKKVLFVGTPCQISAMRSFVDNENLVTVDVICHGVPSLGIFKLYCDFLEKKEGSSVHEVAFRSKKHGWSSFQVSLSFVNGYSRSFFHGWDPFFKGFLKDVYLNEGCYSCPVAMIPRPGDISLGDFWGVPGGLKNEDKGTSVISANSPIGEKILLEVRDEGRLFLKEVPERTAVKSNPYFFMGYRHRPKDRNLLKSLLNSGDFETLIRELKLNTLVSSKIWMVLKKEILSPCKKAVAVAIQFLRRFRS
ncbi:MAG: Coenzyme F420 hydrogenase/dehydrogenase, beta subunit C-terminal domain [Dethiosulfovibrio sp.]|nr:Coenzyme F420 hydrogenase/dehydrogenase, beta subunit C-terminal domain [Dethiosulfovibrio sp.]